MHTSKRVNSAATRTSMLERYWRAVQWTAPKITARTPGIAVDGYWLDDYRYFFLAEKFHTSLGRMVVYPSIADCHTNSIREVIPLQDLVTLLSHGSAGEVTFEMLSSAEFDMPDGNTLAVSVGAREYLVDHRLPAVIRMRTCPDTPELYSPDGRHACFVKGHDLWLRDRESGALRAMTAGGEKHFSFGQQPEIGLSPVSYRRRPHPVGLWSPDSQWFFTHRIDERSIPDAALIQHAPPQEGRPIVHTFKYALPEDPVPAATYVAIHVESGRVVMFNDFPVPVTAFSPFFLRMVWFAGSDQVWCLRHDRFYKRAELILLDLATGTGRVVLTETASAGYIDLHLFMAATPNVRPLQRSPEVVWFSEADGWGHLYLYDTSTGRLKNRITRGEWLVRDIVHVDEDARRLLFLAGGLDPQKDRAHRSLCAVNLDGSGFEVLASHDGDISVAKTEPAGLDQSRHFLPSYAQPGVSRSCRCVVVRYTSVDRGNLTEIVDLRTRQSFSVAAAVPGEGEVQSLRFAALAADGVTRLYGTLFLPSDFNRTRNYPLIDFIYPGPQISQQPQSYRAMRSAQAACLAELGFVTLMLDTRCTPIGNRAFHQAGYGALLEPQLADHAAVVQDLCKRHRFIDRNRIGIIGQSGGATATVRALCDYGDIFKVGVAASGNHDSRYYAAIWSDKCRGPVNDTWPSQANTAAAARLRGKLLLISGDMDENVPMSQTLLLADALVRANKDFDLLIVPNEGHTILLSNGYAQRRAWDYFVQHLLGETPPTCFEIEFEPHELARLANSRREALR